jgi:hypothetical protein
MSTRQEKNPNGIWNEFNKLTETEFEKRNGVQYWSAQDLNGKGRLDLRELLIDGACALKKEDRELRRLLEKSPYARKLKVNKGLAYTLFETTLVYLIFKAWLAKGKHVQWEMGYNENRRRKADLTVGSGKVSIRIECKWWLDNKRKTVDGITADIKKLRGERNGRRVLLTFWWGCEGDCRNWGLIKDKMTIGKKLSPMRDSVFPIFMAKFPTSIENKAEQHHEHKQHFVIAAFEVH